MKSTNGFHGIVDTVLTEIEELREEIDLVPKIITKLNDSSSDDFEFRPLTKKEKKFVNSLDAKGKQILAELEGKPKRTLRLKPRTGGPMFAHFGKFNVA
jgi:hypothetical protein